MEHGLLLDVVIGHSVKLLAGEDETLLISMDAFLIRTCCPHVVIRV